MPYKEGQFSIGAIMATTPQKTGSSIEDAFTADRAMFWQRFTTFTKGAVIVVVLLLLALWIFVV